MTTNTNRAAIRFSLSSNFIFAAIVATGCASSGTEPHAMSAAQHEAAAAHEQQASKEHQAQYNPTAEANPSPSPGSYGLCRAYGGYDSCFDSWAAVKNPTEVHLSDAKRHRELAEQHRAASQALRDAEARSCKDVPDADRDISPFYHREDIVSAGPLSEHTGLGGRRVVGARVVFLALPGMTAEWLQRVVDCHMARNAVMSTADESASYCPLAVPHVKATVTSAGNGFTVDITSENQGSINEVIARAKTLKPNTAPTAER